MEQTEPEVVDGELAPPEGGPALPVPLPRAGALASRPAAAGVLTGFLAGVAALALVRRVSAGPAPGRGLGRGRGRRRRRRRGRHGEVVATRSFLVDVHVLAPRR
jgi:hypothetical protein